MCIRAYVCTCIGPPVLHCCVVVCMSYWSLTATPQHALSVLCICIGYIVYIMYTFYMHMEMIMNLFNWVYYGFNQDVYTQPAVWTCPGCTLSMSCVFDVN